MTAVDDISLSLTPGVWGLLGANGAGKTTLMRMLAGIMQPTSGQITYDGIPISTLGQRYRDIFGYLPQEFGFYPEFTVQDYLEYIAVLKGLTATDSKRKIGELLEQLTLTHVRRKKIAKLSGGASDLDLYADPDTAEYHAMLEEIRKQLNFTSLRYHRLDDMLESIGIDPDKLCTYCWNGKE